MDQCSFSHVLDLIKDDAIFVNNSSQEQTPILLQLQYAFYQLSHDDNSKSFMNTATFWGVSEGHIYNCSKRVIKVLCNIHNTFVKWPNTCRRVVESLCNDAREGFIGAVGKIDKTDIVLHYKPSSKYLGETFWNWKKRYALDLCAVCDSSRSFTYMLAGWPNSAHDACVFASTSIHCESDSYFLAEEYLLGDAAYTNTSHMVTPYKAPASNMRANKRFNQKLSSVQIDIKHAFGMLKGCWQSLTAMRCRIQNSASYAYAVEWITACVVLHNILLGLHDD